MLGIARVYGWIRDDRGARTMTQHEKIQGPSQGPSAEQGPSKGPRARRQKVRSAHPGVVLKKRVNPSGAVVWRARFKDPETGKVAYLKLAGLTTADARREWAITKSKSIAQRLMAIEGGAAKLRKAPLAAAFDAYLGAAEHRLRERTVEAYAAGIALIKEWASQTGIKHTTEINGAKLRGFRDWMTARRKQSPARDAGLRRGGRQATIEKLSPSSTNSYLRSVKVALNELRKSGALAQLTRDAIADSLAPLPVPREQNAHLTAAQCADLIGAAQRHDATCFKMTRSEKVASGAVRGLTQRYEPIAPFVAFVLLSGCRLNEALALEWASVDLDAIDSQGRVVGEIRLNAKHTKTAQARVVALEVSPALRRLLGTLYLRRGKAKYVFGGGAPMSRALAEAARKRMIKSHGAPDFTWQLLRRTCGTFLTNAPGIFGNASAWCSAKQLGHSVTIAERFYVGNVRGIAHEARTLEAAMQIEALLLKAWNPDDATGVLRVVA
jgi:integrase